MDEHRSKADGRREFGMEFKRTSYDLTERRNVLIDIDSIVGHIEIGCERGVGGASRGWKVKIRDRERLEPPHVTILQKTRAWRFDLRSEKFLDKKPDPKEVPEEVVDEIRSNLTLLRREWDGMFPGNPISSEEPDDE
ncbi:MAG: hypothetical protein AUH81_17355 [Candidatus Rokubacteria bacterium 13_1_40CM_4_69_5]|nr:MAG: hypothetical protein AUH81_17355 [Candidatus Rokubacteria bacterium 13_1_40CM_4_69_5]